MEIFGCRCLSNNHLEQKRRLKLSDNHGKWDTPPPPHTHTHTRVYGQRDHDWVTLEVPSAKQWRHWLSRTVGGPWQTWSASSYAPGCLPPGLATRKSSIMQSLCRSNFKGWGCLGRASCCCRLAFQGKTSRLGSDIGCSFSTASWITWRKKFSLCYCHNTIINNNNDNDIHNNSHR